MAPLEGLALWGCQSPGAGWSLGRACRAQVPRGQRAALWRLPRGLGSPELALGGPGVPVAISSPVMAGQRRRGRPTARRGGSWCLMSSRVPIQAGLNKMGPQRHPWSDVGLAFCQAEISWLTYNRVRQSLCLRGIFLTCEKLGPALTFAVASPHGS